MEDAVKEVTLVKEEEGEEEEDVKEEVEKEVPPVKEEEGEKEEDVKEEEEDKEVTLIKEEEEDKEEDVKEEEKVIEFSRDAPMAPILGPFCVICGKFGQYVCDRTDEDVCSMECKRKAEALAARASSPPPPDAVAAPQSPQSSQPLIGVSNSEQHVYLPSKHRFKSAVTILDSHKCPLCGRTGHLPQDSRYAAGHDIDVSDFQLGGEEIRQVLHCGEMPRWEVEEVEVIRVAER